MLSCFSRVWLFVTLWTVGHQDSLSIGFSRQEYWSGLPCPPPGDLPDPEIEHASPVSPTLAGRGTHKTRETGRWRQVKGWIKNLYMLRQKVDEIEGLPEVRTRVRISTKEYYGLMDHDQTCVFMQQILIVYNEGRKPTQVLGISKSKSIQSITFTELPNNSFGSIQ